MDSQAGTHYYLDDHLGTTQMELSGGGWPLWKGEFAPFGQELDNQNTAMHYKFTGKERDAESGLDYFGARYYASSMGRFMSPDWADKPEAVPYSSLGNPQSLNLYQYVGNNPLSKADPDGHDPDPQAQAAVIPVLISIGTTTGEGAAEGSAAGPVGMAVGAGVGLLMGVGAAAIEYSPKLAPVPVKSVTTIQLKSVPKAGPKATPGTRGGKKVRTAEGKKEQREGISKEQERTNKTSRGQYDMKSGKSDQAEQQEHKSYKNLKDAEQAHHDQ